MRNRVQKLPDPAPETDAVFPAESWPRVAVWSITAGLLLAMASPFAAHIPIALGVWPKVESTIILVHIGAAACAAGLLVACITANRFAAESIRHPVVMIAAGIALWSIALSPTARYPLLSITGSPQIADGALMWLDIAVFIAGARLLQRFSRPTEFIGFAILFAAIVLPLLAWFPATRGIWFNDHLAFLGLAAAVSVPAALGSRFTTPRSRVVLALLAGIPALIVSQNFSAFAILCCISLPAYVATNFIRRAKDDAAVSFARVLAASIIGLSAIAAPFVVSVFGWLDSIGSMQSRAQIIEALSSYIVDNPLTLLVGNGWGHTEQLFAESLIGVEATIWDRSWDAAWRDIFHSHNLILEAVLSAGLPAAFAVAAFSAVLPLFCPARSLPAATAYTIGYVGIASVWFQMPGTVPFTALAVGLLSGNSGPVPATGPAKLVTTPVLAATIAIQLIAATLLGMLSWQYFQLDRALASRSADVSGTDSNHATKCGTFPPEGWRGDTGFALQFIRSYDIVVAPPKDHTVSTTDIEKLDYFACTASLIGVAHQSRAVLRAALLFRAQLAYNANFTPYRDRLGRYLEDWEDQVDVFLKLEPKRSDLVYPFLSWSLLQNRYPKVLSITDNVLEQYPRDAIASWFKGLALFQRGDKKDRNEALQHLRAGLQQGVEKWFSIPSETKKLIREAK